MKIFRPAIAVALVFGMTIDSASNVRQDKFTSQALAEPLDISVRPAGHKPSSSLLRSYPRALQNDRALTDFEAAAGRRITVAKMESARVPSWEAPDLESLVKTFKAGWRAGNPFRQEPIEFDSIFREAFREFGSMEGLLERGSPFIELGSGGTLSLLQMLREAGIQADGVSRDFGNADPRDHAYLHPVRTYRDYLDTVQPGSIAWMAARLSFRRDIVPAEDVRSIARALRPGGILVIEGMPGEENLEFSAAERHAFGFEENLVSAYIAQDGHRIQVWRRLPAEPAVQAVDRTWREGLTDGARHFLRDPRHGLFLQNHEVAAHAPGEGAGSDDMAPILREIPPGGAYRGMRLTLSALERILSHGLESRLAQGRRHKIDMTPRRHLAVRFAFHGEGQDLMYGDPEPVHSDPFVVVLVRADRSWSARLQPEVDLPVHELRDIYVYDKATHRFINLNSILWEAHSDRAFGHGPYFSLLAEGA